MLAGPAQVLLPPSFLLSSFVVAVQEPSHLPRLLSPQPHLIFLRPGSSLCLSKGLPWFPVAYKN